MFQIGFDAKLALKISLPTNNDDIININKFPFAYTNNKFNNITNFKIKNKKKNLI